MARPRKQGLDYFPLNTDFFEDDKIVPVTGEFGLKGEIVAIKLLCAIYRKGYFIEWNVRLRLKFLRDLPGISAALLDMIISRLVQWGFFDETLFNTAGILTSRGIQRRYFEITSRRLIDHELPHLLVSVSRNSVNGSRKPRSAAVSACSNTTKETKDNISILSSISSSTPRAYEGENDDAWDATLSKFISEKEKSCAEKEKEPARLSANAVEYIRIDQVAEYLKSDPYWLEVLCVNRHLRMDYVLSKIDEFAVELLQRGDTEKDKRDCRRHFNNWLRKNRNSNEVSSAHRASNGDITNAEVLHRCQERVAERLAREKAREVGQYDDAIADPF